MENVQLDAFNAPAQASASNVFQAISIIIAVRIVELTATKDNFKTPSITPVIFVLMTVTGAMDQEIV